MKMNKKLFLKMIIIFCLVGICFTPMVYAGDAYILKESEIIPGTETTAIPLYQDNSYLYIPFTSVGEPESDPLTNMQFSYEEAKIGDITITAKTTTTEGAPTGTTTYSFTLPDGTSVDNFEIILTNPADGTEVKVPVPSVDNLIYGGVLRYI